MAKKMALPVAKANKPIPVKIVSEPSAPSTSDRYAKEERNYRAESAARTLAEAQRIKGNKELMKDVKQHIKDMSKAICK